METSVPVSVPPKQVKRSRRGRWLLLGLMLVGAIWFVPDLVARTALRNEVGRILFPSFRGRITLGETRLGWLQPISARNIRVLDRTGALLVTVDSLQSSHTLWQLARKPQQLGTYRLQGLTAHVTTDGVSTNFDETIVDFSAPATPEDSAWRLELDEVRVEISTDSSQEPRSITGLQAIVDSQAAKRSEFLVELKAHQHGHPRLQVALQQSVSTGEMKGRWQADHWSLHELAAVVPDLNVAGNLAGSGTWIWSPRESKLVLETDADLQQIVLRGGAWLANDELAMERCTVRGGVQLTPTRVHLQDLICQTDFAEVRGIGSTAWPTAEWDATQLPAHQLQLHGNVNLAELARHIPHLLGLRDGTRITSGQLEFDLSSLVSNERAEWNGTLKLHSAAAETGGRTLRWEQPIEAIGTLTRTPDGAFRLERGQLRSDYATADVSGTWQQAELKFTADLDRLLTDLQPLLVWDDVQLAGSVRGSATIQQPQSDRVELQGDVQVNRFVWQVGKEPAWSEPQLTANLSAQAEGTAAAPWTRITTAAATILAGNDRLAVSLVEPVTWSDRNAQVAVQIAGRGDLARWQRRAGSFIATPGLDLAGQGELSSTVILSRDEIQIQSSKFQGKPLHLTSADLRIAEPDFQMETSGTWSTATGTWKTPQTLLTGEFGRLSWRDGQYHLNAPMTESVRGTLDFDVDLGRLSRFRGGDVLWHVLGNAVGTAEFVPRREALGLTVRATASDVVVVGWEPPAANAPGRWTPRWREPQLRADVSAEFQPAQSQWTMSAGQLSMSGLAMKAQGQATTNTTQTSLTLQGDLTYDWDLLTERMSPEWTSLVQLAGRGTRPFQFNGSLPSSGQLTDAVLRGDVGVAWERGQIAGLALGAAEPTIDFRQTSAILRPLTMQVGDGHVHLAPTLTWEQEPARITLPPGLVVDRLRLSPALCSSGLKYVAPLLADATETEGEFSWTVQNASFPLGQMAAGESQGTLDIHGARVRPGPLAQRLLGTVEQVRALIEHRAQKSPATDRIWLELPEQSVNYRLTQGQVGHQSLALRLGEVDVRTSGWVGFDESLQLTLEVPVKDEWLSDDKLARLFQGQTLRIPVRGTIRQPQVDPRVFNELARNAAGGQVERVIENQLQKQLDRLLPSRK